MAKKASFRSKIGKTLTTISSPMMRIGFSKIDLWVSTSNYAMNRLWSGRWDRGLLFGRNYIFYGESGSGKSLFCAVIAGNAQREHNAIVYWVDAEHANDDEAGQAWLKRAGVDLDEEKFIYASMAELSDFFNTVARVAKDYRQAEADGEELQPMVIIVDSWAAFLTESQAERTYGSKELGKLVGDQGQKAKQTGDVINRINHLIAGLPIMVVGVQHIMDNQDGYGRKHKTTGGNKMVFMASGAMMLTKKELKLEETDADDVVSHYKSLEKTMTADAKKKAGGDKRFVGIEATMEILKTRVAKPFEKVHLQIPFLTGLDPYSGLFDLLQQEGTVTVPSSGWYQYFDKAGQPVKFRKADFRSHADAIMEASAQDISNPDEAAKIAERRMAEAETDVEVEPEDENEGVSLIGVDDTSDSE